MYDPSILPQGRVLDVRTRRLDVNWLIPCPFVGTAHEHEPSHSIRPYENLSSFRHPRDLRRAKDVARYDHNRKPPKGDGIVSGKPLISSGDVYYPGDQVFLRNPGHHSNIPQVATVQTYHFDMNAHTIFLGLHRVSVLWQDGTTTMVESTNLTPYSLPESDLCPGDLVLAKEGLRMIGLDSGGRTITSDFNEMSFFERDHTLVPAKVGVLQSVDGQERLARVRWYANPEIELRAYGQVLQARFGKIGEEVEEVSLYEIMTEPALIRKRGDLLVVPPLHSPKPRETQDSFPPLLNDILAGHHLGTTTLSYLRQMTSHVVPALWEIARPFADQVTISPSPSVPMYDWIGEIVDIGLDGSLVVRFGGLKDCKDVIISQDKVLLIVDENAEYSDPIDDSMDIDGMGAEYTQSRSEGSSVDINSDEESAIDEVVEYEGGERLDNDSGEDEWSTDDETPESIGQSAETNNARGVFEDVHDGGGGMEIDEPTGFYLPEVYPELQYARPPLNLEGTSVFASAPDRICDAVDTLKNSSAPTTLTKERPELHLSSHNSSTSTLSPHLMQSDAPSRFEILDKLPPQDQYNHAEIPTNHSTFLKRIAKEHRILSSSLPDGEIYVRTYESRLDLLRCLIIGPADTPYEYSPFVIDLHLGPNFPKEPPKAHFHSWTSGLGRINPNLYEEGKICLSLLGTWPGQSEQEGWSDKATILQVLVSLQGLVFVSQPFYNEAGFETYGEEKVYSLESQQYSEKAYVIARGFVKYALDKAPRGLEDVIAWLYLCSVKDGAENKTESRLLSKVIERAKLLMERSSGLKQLASLEASGQAEPHITKANFLIDGVGDSSDTTKTFLKPLSQGAMVMLRKTVAALEDIQRRYENVAT